MVVFGGTAVIARTRHAGPSARNHRGGGDETHEVWLRDHGITAPGTLDGGDVLKVGDIMYVRRGADARTAKAFDSCGRCLHRWAGG